MNTLFDIVALGELLIDFTYCGKSENGMNLFEQNPGGAPANVLSCLSKLGKNTAFIGKVGKDMHGEFLKSVLQENKVDTSGLIEDKDAFTTLAFVSLSDNGERTFSFSRKPGADTLLRPEEINEKIIKNSKIFHIGSLSLTDEPAKSATLKAIDIAKENNLIISYDPNYRELLWENRETAIIGMRSVLPFIDIIKISDEETELLTDIKDPKLAAEKLVKSGITIVVVTLGEKGTLVCTKEGSAYVNGFKTTAIDTTGAGDAFFGGFLNKIIEDKNASDKIGLSVLCEYAKFGNAVASLCVENRGAIPAMPKLEDVLNRMKYKS